MQQNFKSVLYVLGTAVFLYACTSSRQGTAGKNEQVKMNISEKENVIDYGSLKQQNIPDMASRSDKDRGNFPALLVVPFL